MKLFLLLVVFGVWSMGSMAFAKGGSSGGVGHRVEINGFYGMASVAPGDLNNGVDSFNASPATSTKLGKISSTTIFGGEFLYSLNPMFQLGARYTSQSATTGDGNNSLVGKTNYKIQLDDAGLVAKYMWAKNSWAFGIGAEGGMSTTFKATIQTLGTTTDYNASSAFVGRGFLTGRINLGMVGIFLEGGYQMASASELKDKNGTKLTSGGKTSAVNANGAYGLAGLGLQF